MWLTLRGLAERECVCATSHCLIVLSFQFMSVPSGRWKFTFRIFGKYFHWNFHFGNLITHFQFVMFYPLHLNNPDILRHFIFLQQYVMWESRVKGKALVIGNANFPQTGELPASPRPWADMDITNMNELLGELGYKVQDDLNFPNRYVKSCDFSSNNK